MDEHRWLSLLFVLCSLLPILNPAVAEYTLMQDRPPLE